MPNPYTLLPVDDPKYFIANSGGRGEQVGRILENLCRVNTQPNPISLIGERRFGKSSLLAYLERATVNVSHLLTVYIDLLGLSPQTPEGFYATLTESLIWAGILPDTNPVFTYPTFQRFLYGLRRAGKRLILLIDEFDLVARDRRFDRPFFDNLRSAISRYPLTLVVASVAPLKGLAHQNVFTSPFWNVFYKERLGLLSQMEAKALISQGGGPDGLGNIEDKIIELAGCHPFFLQLACSLAWEMRTTIGDVNFDKLRSEFMNQVHDHYQYIWEHSTDTEQKTLCALANGMQPDGTGLRTLMERGYVDAEARVDKCGAGFAAFVRAQCVTPPAVQEKGQSSNLRAPAGMPTLIDQSKWTSDVAERRIALVVGINNYLYQETGDYFLAPLQYAERDAAEVADLLRNIGYEVTHLLGPQATYRAIQAKFDEWSQATLGSQHPESRFVFHFSGHGMIDPHHREAAYLILYDTDPSNLTTGLEMMHLVYDFLPKVHLRHSLVLLDACHAGFAAGVRDVHPETRWLPNVTQQAFSIAPGRMILAACPGEARAREIASLQHGIFTHYVLKHWRDLEDPHPPDRITFGSLVDYVGSKMPVNHPQIPLPVYNGVGVGGTLILYRIPQQSVPDGRN